MGRSMRILENETSGAGPRVSGEKPVLDCCPVDADEMSYAIEIFLAAAHGRLLSRNTAGGERAARESRALLVKLSSAVPRSVSAEVGTERSPSLQHAFQALWQEYSGAVRQISVCARVLGFYNLMISTRGAAVERWTTECPDSHGLVALDPAVVRALSEVILTDGGLLPEEAFLMLVERLAADSDQGLSPVSDIDSVRKMA